MSTTAKKSAYELAQEKVKAAQLEEKKEQAKKRMAQQAKEKQKQYSKYCNNAEQWRVDHSKYAGTMLQRLSQFISELREYAAKCSRATDDLYLVHDSATRNVQNVIKSLTEGEFLLMNFLTNANDKASFSTMLQKSWMERYQCELGVLPPHMLNQTVDSTEEEEEAPAPSASPSPPGAPSGEKKEE